MTEEIIIDCAFYKDGVCASPINKTCEYCKNIDVSKCYHKQLKRLELERDEWKKKYEDVANENLKALCQKCHLNYDKEHHKETRRKTKEEKTGQLKLINKILKSRTEAE